MPITILIDPPGPHPLAWIHRAEARAIARELRESARAVRLLPFPGQAIASGLQAPLLLRLSDPAMLAAVRCLEGAGIPYIGPGAQALARCYDKYDAYRSTVEQGIDTPATALATQADTMAFPLLLKPRRGSDSIGLRVLRSGPIPARVRTDDAIAQEFVRGSELTVGALHGEIGAPLHIVLPEGTPYRFWRKYAWRPRREPVRNAALYARAREAAHRIAAMLGVDWAARIDFIHETATDRLRFLECDAAPLVGPASAFAESLAASGVARHEQLRRLLAESG